MHGAFTLKTLIVVDVAVTGANRGIGGTLVASAGRDLNIVAGVVSNSGTGNTTLSADNSVNLSSIKTGQSQNSLGATNRSTSNKVTDIQSGGNLTIQATKNVNVEGGNLGAQGDFKLTSTLGSVNLKAVVDAASDGAPNRQNQTQDIKGVQINAGGKALVQATEGDIRAQSLQLQAGQKATLKADAGKVDLTSAQTYSKTQAGSDVRQSLVTERTQILGGTGVVVYGQQSVNIVSADIKATSGQAKASSAGDVTLGFNTDTQQHNWTSTSTSGNVFKKKTTTTQHETLDKTAQVTAISGDQVVVLGNNVKGEGAKLQGAQLVQVEGSNNTQLYAVQDVHQKTQNSQTSSRFMGITYSKTSSTDNILKSEALGTQLSSNKAIQIGVGALTDVQGAILTAPKVDFVRSADADTSKAGELILGGSTNTTQTSHTEKTTTAGVWQAQSGQGETKQTLNQTQINGKANMASSINTSVVIPEGNLKTQVQTLSQQPGMSYLNELSKDPKVNWDQVKLAYDKWDYKQEGLTPAGAILLSIAVTAATGGMGAELAGAASTTTTAGVATTTTTIAIAGTTLATTVGATTTYTAAGAALNAGFSALAAQASVSLANNGGDTGKTLKELGLSNTVKNTLVAMATAGVGTSVAGQGVSAVAAQTVAGCASGAVTGAGCEQGAKTAAVLSTAGETYQSLVGYAANAGPGENRNGTKLDGTSTGNGTYEYNQITGQQLPQDRGMNVVGFNDPKKIGAIGAQGGAVSRALNQVPFINATAGLHDYIFNANTDFNFTLWNVPTMAPAAALSIPAALSNPNISWMTQVKQPESVKPPVLPSVIRIDSNLTMQNAVSIEEQK